MHIAFAAESRVQVGALLEARANFRRRRLRASSRLAMSRLPGKTRTWFSCRSSRRASSSQDTAMRTLVSASIGQRIQSRHEIPRLQAHIQIRPIVAQFTQDGTIRPRGFDVQAKTSDLLRIEIFRRVH
jgi:hypothetical protein